MNWSKILCGGGGWTVNAERRQLIDEVKENLEMWRDFDDGIYLDTARRLLEDAK